MCKEMKQSCSLGRGLGEFLAVHTALMLSLAAGVSPKSAVRALAWAALPFTILFIAQKDGGLLAMDE